MLILLCHIVREIYKCNLQGNPSIRQRFECGKDTVVEPKISIKLKILNNIYVVLLLIRSSDIVISFPFIHNSVYAVHLWYQLVYSKIYIKKKINIVYLKQR